jgi:hypothetical protein
MTTHTPGPYIIGKPGGPSGPFYSLVNQQGRVVAMQVPNEADAHLLSTAPDLLECCKGADALISYMIEQGICPVLRIGEGEDMTMQLLRDIRAAIRAAKGEYA